ncbi:MAG: hypothetical protein IKW90_00475 [Lachnospiraceae bacterium]|nr:hypothetical protein [Lachnospiraceae bacterium]
MKRVTKLLAALLVLVLVIGAIPVQAASTPSLKKSSKILYLGGCKGTKANGTKANFSESVKASKLLKGFKSSTMDIKLESSNEKVAKVSNSNGTITAVGRGTAKVMITVRNKSTEKTIFAKEVKITVKKNADANFSVTGIKDGAEYEVGKSLTVVLTRKSDDDYRKLTVDNSGAALTKKNSAGSKYTVKFNEPGTYTFTATAYQSSTYAGATAKKTFTVTVKGAAPTPTPTAAPTPTTTPTPTAAPSSLSIKQTALDTFVISGVKNAADIKAKDIKIYTLLTNDIEYNKSAYIKSVSASTSGTDLTVVMLSNFDSDTVHYVELPGITTSPLSFKAVGGTEMDIARIEVTNTKVLYNTMADLGLKYYNADGVDITSNVKDKVLVEITNAEQNVYDAYASGTQVYFSTPNKVHYFNISVLKGYVNGTAVYEKKENVAIMSYEPQFDRIIYTVTTDDGTYLKATDTLNHTFTVDDTSAILEVLFVYKDAVTGTETYKTMAEEGIEKVDTNNGKIMFIGATASTGGYKLIPNNTGVVTVVLYKNGRDYAVAEVEIKAAKKVSTVVATVNKNFLNVNPAADDSIEITAVVKDQYGDEMKDQPITITQLDTTYATGIVSFGGFVGGKLKVPGATVAFSKEGVITAKVTCGTVSTNVMFTVGDKSEATAWRLSNPEVSVYAMDTAIKEGDVKPQVTAISVQGVNGNYTVKKEFLKFMGKAVTAQLKASDFGLAEGTKIYVYTIQKDSQYLSALPDLVTDDSIEVKFQSFDYQKKLAAGQYTFTAYSLVLGASNSQIAIIGQKNIVVSNNQPTVSYKFVKDKTTQTAPIAIATDCYEFYIDGKKLPTTAVVDADVAVNGDGTSKLVKSVTITINNTVYGDFQQKVTLAGADIIK